MGYTDDLHSLSHTKWNCKYHIVFAPKYRKKHSMSQGGLMSEECYGNFANGNM